jgi:hypothetical protein
MAREIIDADSTETICEIFKIKSVSAMYESEAVDWDNPPYVRIGNLFVSLTISGPDSWGYIARKVCAKDNLTVLSGRHGNVINPIDSSGWLRRKEESMTQGDAVDPQEDRKRAATINNKANPRITVIDVRDDEFRTAVGLRGKILQYLQSGGVILSWCYGLYTMQVSYDVKHGEDISSPDHGEYAKWRKLLDSRICDIVKSDWYWVPRS